MEMAVSALQASIYRERQGVDFLSPSYQSNYHHQPQYTDRITVSQRNFERHRDGEIEPILKLPWGRRGSYGGEGAVALPEENSTKGEPATLLQKGHLHYGAGDGPHPRGVPTDQYYTLTPLRLSHVRLNDQLLPTPQTSELGKLQIKVPFPSEHPYSSHMSQKAMFPTFENEVDDMRKGRGVSQMAASLPATAPASAPHPTILGKAKGNFARHEAVPIQRDAERKYLTWPGENFYQLVKGPGQIRQRYYPTPPTSVLPNMPERLGEMKLSARTANALYNLYRSYRRTEYQSQFAGRGPQNVLKLDNYEDVLGGDDELRMHKENSTLPPRPLEGRYSTVTKMQNEGTLRKYDEAREQQRKTEEEQDEEEEVEERRRRFQSNETADIFASKNKHHVGEHNHLLEETKYGGGKFTEKVCVRDDKEITMARLLAEKENPMNWVYFEPEARYISRYEFLEHSRPQTAPADNRPTSPVVANMPSQTFDATSTGTTNPTLYPKWFRSKLQYEKRPSTALLELQQGFNKSEIHRRFHLQYPERAPDIRQKPDMRITTNERRHVIPEIGCHGYYFH